MKGYYIITFINTYEAMKAEKEIINNNINAIVMPTPTYITKSCGISLKIEVDDYEKLSKLIDEKSFSFKNIYLKEEEGFSVIV
ncbi:hypothetical protein CLTEP_19510 [Clostridium tepidiprofundi DSM 19306]|uniref:Putative Se/S carrier protein-like domain-containing protein n=1 Tax=Clostridium tepidiprofundi DSM 19306 TaxID=1121338 RepID=A0A151B2I9_9CLOT|nr:DUF3343 domain-containing protein [Clostridium tepidiprofundi]KYH34106.1 hypothetical protein CLTEP_19510 [Clostridium tepidiprofundi DSM 19306]